MKSDLIRSLKLTLSFCVFFSVFYIFILWAFARVAGPNKGNAELVVFDGKVVGAARVGQAFSRPVYFWGRPSAVDYAADGSGGSNHGPSNPEHLKNVEDRIAAFLKAHPYLERKDVPVELVTASGSGLDPDISPEGAFVQVKRVAAARGMAEEKVKAIVASQVEKPLWGVFGPAKVNVLKLNVALELAGKQNK